VEIQKEHRLAGLVTITRDTRDYTTPTAYLLEELEERGWLCKVVHRRFNHHVNNVDPGLTRDLQVILATDSLAPR
jgi:hypothetical protein